MSTVPVTNAPKKVGKPAKPPTEQQKKITALQDLKSKKKATEAQISELKVLVVAERKLTLSRLAAGRINKLSSLMRQIGNLAAYKPSENQTKLVFGKIKQMVDAAFTKWSGNLTTGEDSFELPVE